MCNVKNGKDFDMYVRSQGGHVPLAETPSDFPLASLPGGKSVRKEFFLPHRKRCSAKIHPRTAHIAAADLNSKDSVLRASWRVRVCSHY